MLAVRNGSLATRRLKNEETEITKATGKRTTD